MTLPHDIKERLRQPDIPPFAPRETDLMHEDRRVVLIILDGISKFVFDQANIPTIRTLEKKGFSYDHCVTTTPTITYSAHTSIHTGTYPKVHGIGLPWTYSREKGIHRSGDSSFRSYLSDSLKMHGMSSAAVSDGAAKNSFVSVYGEGFFGHSIADVAAELRHVFFRYRPKLTAVTFYATDTLSHFFGVGHDLVHEALEDIDEEIARFAEELADQGELDNITWIFTADHGMASTKNSIDAWVDDAHSRGLWVAPNGRCLLVEDSVVPELLKEDWIDKVLQHDVCMSLGLNVDEGRSLVTVKPGFGYLGAHAEVANHGGLTEAERRVPLVFSGSGVTAGQSDTPVETVDIAPTIAEALGGAWLETFAGRVLMEAFGHQPSQEGQALSHKRQKQYDYLHGPDVVLEIKHLS